jgi:hypothetical protein
MNLGKFNWQPTTVPAKKYMKLKGCRDILDSLFPIYSLSSFYEAGSIFVAVYPVPFH